MIRRSDADGTRDSRESHRRAAGLSLVEALVSSVVVAVMLVAALQMVAVSKATQAALAARARGQMLAQRLMCEILAQHYADPAFGVDSFGIGADELTGDRGRFEDVDDYDDWTASPPQEKDGTVMEDLTGWRHSVEVVWVEPSDLATTADENEGVKRITVTVSCDGIDVASLVAVRTSAWPG